VSKLLYRYEIHYKNEDGDTEVVLREIPIMRETEKMYFISWLGYGIPERRVSKDAHNTYAYDNKADAKAHFIRRTNKRISWYEYWKEECEKALDLIKELE